VLSPLLSEDRREELNLGACVIANGMLAGDIATPSTSAFTAQRDVQPSAEVVQETRMSATTTPVRRTTALATVMVLLAALFVSVLPASSAGAVADAAPVVIDDFNRADPVEWGFFDGSNAGGGGGLADDRPYEGSGYLTTGWGGEGTASVFYGGAFRNFPNDAQPVPPDDPWLNVWVRNRPTSTVDGYSLELTIREDTDGDGWTDGEEDSFRLDTAFTSADFDDQWRLVSAPVSSMTDLETGGNGTFDGALDEVVIVIGGVTGANPSDVVVDFDLFAFSSGGPLEGVPAVQVIDDFESGAAPGTPCASQAPPLGFCTFNGAGSSVTIATATTPPAPELEAVGTPNSVLQLDLDVTSFAGFIRGFESGGEWVSQDWSTREGISLWFYGLNSGTTVFIDILENRNPGSTTDDAERYSVEFVDDFTGWQLLEFPFSAFSRKEVGNGAPNDGFDRFEVHGWALGTLGTGGPRTFYVDEVSVYGEAGVPPVTVNLAQQNTFVEEGQTAEVVVRLNRPLGPDDPDTVSIDYATERSNAVAGEEFTPASGTLTFTKGGPAQLSFAVETFDDSRFEGDELIVIRLTNPVGAERGSLFQGSVIIVDTDPFDPDEIDEFTQGAYLWDVEGPATLEHIRVAETDERARPGQDAVEDLAMATVPQTVGAVDPGLDFSDVSAGNVHRDNILALASAGIIVGFDDGTFRPFLNVTRGQLSSILARTAELEPAEPPYTFTDIAGSVHAGSIQALADAGIISGFSDGTFRPSLPVARAQAASLIGRWIEVDEVADGPFTDVAPGGVHSGYINALNQLGIILGRTPTTFEPGSPLQRAQAASIVARTLDVVAPAQLATSFVRDFPSAQDWTGTEAVSFWYHGAGAGDDVVVTLKDNRAPDPGPEGWDLVWSDEFDAPAGTVPDPDSWAYELGDMTPDGKNGWGNDELQFYTDDPANAAHDGDGNLVITLKESDGSQECYYGPCEFTSARLLTQHKEEFAYGRIESRLKVPDGGPGLWPAFWSLGTDITYNPWPGAGEIDIMEYVSRLPEEIFGTVHGPGYSGGGSIGDIFDFGMPVYEAPLAGTDDFSNEGYHTFTVDWEPNLITWYVDGVQYHQVTPDDLPGPWVFDKPYFLLLNFAIGGNFGGAVSPDNVYPQEYLVDYVRVYQGPDTAERFEASFVDDVAGWREVTVPIDDFVRSDEQPEGAPDDGLGLDEVWGVGLTLPNGNAAGGFMLDAVRRVPEPLPDELVVTTLADSGEGSLRDALSQIAEGGTITFDPALAGETIPVGTELVANRSVTIDATAAPDIVLDGQGEGRVLRVTAGATVALHHLVIANGAGTLQGGGVQNLGTLHLDHVVVRDNVIPDTAGTDFQNGGAGIYNGTDAVLTLTDSTVADNTSVNQPGGGIYGFFGSDITITRSTVSGNESGDVAGGLRSLGDATIVNSTFSGNVSTVWHGGGIFHTDGSLTVTNSTFAENVAPAGTASGILVASFGAPADATLTNNVLQGHDDAVACAIEGGGAATITSGGGNVISDGSCNPEAADQSSTDALLGPLGDNGGPTLTHVLLEGSPAIDAAGADACPATDQRGIPRPQGSGCDAGAFEREP
jgi:beta-glucanase (GH16 family)